jgi:hypothetical protein
VRHPRVQQDQEKHDTAIPTRQDATHRGPILRQREKKCAARGNGDQQTQMIEHKFWHWHFLGPDL